NQPLWFGGLLGIAFRHREFTLYAVPALLLLEAVRGDLDSARVRQWVMAAAMFFAVWESVEALKPFADLAGPGTRGQLLGGFSGSQVENLVGRFNWQPGALAFRLTQLWPDMLAWFMGAKQVQTSLPVPDREWLLRAASVALICAFARVVY